MTALLAAKDLAAELVSEASRSRPMEQVLARICEALSAAGVPLVRATANVRTMHPEVYAARYRWDRRQGAIMLERGHDVTRHPEFGKSPISEVSRTPGYFLRRRLEVPETELEYEFYRELRAEGCTDYVIWMSLFDQGIGQRPDKWGCYVSFAVDRPGGYDDVEIAALREIVPALSLRLELAATYHTLRSLLGSYVGRGSAARILSGSYRQGQGERMVAVLWACDLRGFTAMVDQQPFDAALAALDAYFIAVTEPVATRGGEVLKFIGDAVLAIFPVGERSVRAVADEALAAAREAFSATAASNTARIAAGLPALSFGLALHVGEVMYGNVGARGRLDFTVFGPPVNEVFRLEAMCKELDVPFLLSEELAREVEGASSLGRHALRGVAREHEIFTVAGVWRRPA
jgi:adenylate cyclase